MRIYNWATLGCGHIAKKFVADLKLLPNAKLYAAASREFEKAKEFALAHGCEKAYGSYLEMVNDPQVDVVTRTIKVKARIDNHDGLLRPGLFANVDLALGVHENATVIPEEAILAHDGEAHVSRDRFRDLTQGEKNKLLAFLKSL